MLDTAIPVFIATAESGSFTKAAERLYVTPTAVMKQINRLEAQIGVKLMERGPGGISLTQAGGSYYVDAVNMTELSQQARDRARAQAVFHKKIIRIGDSRFFPCGEIAQLWQSAVSRIDDEKIASQYTIQIVRFDDAATSLHDDVPDKLGQAFDVLAGYFDEHMRREYAFTALRTSASCVLVPVDNPLACRRTIDITDLYGQRLMIPESAGTPLMDEIAGTLQSQHPGIMVERIPYRPTIDMCNQCADNGTLLLALEHWDSIHPMMALVHVNWPFRIPYGLMVSTQAPQDILDFVNLIIDESAAQHVDDDSITSSAQSAHATRI